MLGPSIRALAAATLVIAASGCAKGTQGNIGTGGAGGVVSTSMSSASAGGGGVGGGPTTTSSGMGGATSSSTTGPTTSSSSGSGGACSGTHLLISQIKTRGAAGGNDEFVELLNPTASAVTFDNTWTLMVRSLTAASYSSDWKGGNSPTTNTIPAHGHYLITGSAYAGGPSGDDALSSGIKDAASVVLQHSGSDVDAACFGYPGSATFDSSFTCNLSAADNSPHDDTTGGSSNTDVSIERKNGGCAETGVDANDFASTSPSAPHNHTN